jgi:23S rRNA pseudouridine1911/1915/1917 synthase
MIKITSEISDTGERLDKFLASKVANIHPEITRTKIQKFIKEGFVKDINGNKITEIKKKIVGEEEFSVEIAPPKPILIKAKNIPFEIIFEDEDLVIVNKPAGLTTHPGAGNADHTLVNALLYFYQNNLSKIAGKFRPGIVHRLDKNTSGLMIVAKNDFAHKKLSDSIANREISRKYLAFCFGVPIPNAGKIDKNIDRSRKNRLKMCVVKNSGRIAITNYKLKKTYQNNLFSLIECSLETGRTHQIRVHLTSIDNSLIGDNEYGHKNRTISNISSDLQKFISDFDRQALHSYKLSFLHPRNEEEMNFEIELPEDLQELEKKLETF